MINVFNSNNFHSQFFKSHFFGVVAMDFGYYFSIVTIFSERINYSDTIGTWSVANDLARPIVVSETFLNIFRGIENNQDHMDVRHVQIV